MTEEKKTKVEIVVDNKATEKLVSILEKERTEKEQAKTESSLNDLIVQTTRKFGRADLWTQATSKEMLNAMLTNFINEVSSQSKAKEQGGNAPLNAQQYGAKSEDLYTRKFYDSQQMVSELRRLSHEGTPQEKQEAEHYLNELWKKYILDKRSQPTRSEASQNSNTPEALSELDLVQRDGFLTPRNKEDGDIQKLQRAWRLERKRKMREGSEEQ